MMKEYIPNPADTQSVELPQELLPLIEEMAKNVHEVWAQNRMKDGWSYGAVRDDAGKKHPCLVPYEELPESEKEYDRIMTMNTFRLVHCIGFDIVNCNKS